MAEKMQETRAKRPAHVTDHMANERTFLAWIRTSIGVMAFGFVVEKFALFMKKLAYFLGKEEALASPPQSFGYSTVFGIVVVALGALMGLLAFIRYRKVEAQIDAEAYAPSFLLDLMLALGLVVIGTFLVFYMLHSVLS